MFLSVGISYIMMGLPSYKLVERLQLHSTPTSRNIGKYLYRSGWMIVVLGLVSYIPGVPDMLVTILFACVVLGMTILTLKTTQRMRAELTYTESYMKRIIDELNQKEFNVSIKRFREAAFHEEVIKRLANEGILEKWLGSKMSTMSHDEKARYESYRLVDVLNRISG